MVNCCVINCHNRTHDRKGIPLRTGVRFFRFPAWKRHQGADISELTKRRRAAWVEAVSRESLTFSSISKNMFVCSRHFHGGKPAYEMRECDPDWVPSLHLGHTEGVVATTDRNQRKMKRPQAPAPAPEPSPVEPQVCSLCVLRSSEIDRLLEENRKLKLELSQKSVDEHFLKDDDVKVRYYTGLPCFATVMALVTQLRLCLPQAGLSPFQVLLLTLMHLRLNLPDQHVAHLFSINRKTVSTTFRDTIGVMFSCLSPLVRWPERHCLQRSMTPQFVEAFGDRVSVILDCFEINIERASLSHYEHKHTLKYLIGITPQGTIAFISKGWGGHVSDKHVTENCGILQKLLPGDLVLADRGFDIRNSDGLMCAEVKTSEFAAGRRQLDVSDVAATRQMAPLRVHVERVTGSVRAKYAILGETIPLNMVLPCEGEDMTLLDKIVCVCCALTNMCPSVAMKPHDVLPQ